MAKRTGLEGSTLATLDALGLPRDLQPLAYEARAKLTWGDRPVDVETSLIVSAVDPQTARLIVETCLRERAITLRAKGVKDLTAGVIAVGVGVAGAIGIGRLQAVVDTADLAGYLMAACALAGVYGMYRLARGLERIIFGAHTAGAVSDLDEWE